MHVNVPREQEDQEGGTRICQVQSLLPHFLILFLYFIIKPDDRKPSPLEYAKCKM